MRVYKYLTPERIDVLKNQKIRFTQANLLNDPFESLPYVAKIMSETDESTFYDDLIRPVIGQFGNRKLSAEDIPTEYRSQISDEVLKEISKYSIEEALGLIPALHPRELSKVLFTSTGEELDLNLSEKLKNSWSTIYGILSLATSNSNITMWSHYAQYHAGFVVEFDLDNEMFHKKVSDKDPFRILKPVQYSKKRPSLELLKFDLSEEEYIFELANKILYTKSLDWSYENEYRIIYDLREHDEKIARKEQDIYLFDFRPSAIKSLFIGVNSSYQFKEDIYAVLAKKEFSHVKIYQGRLDRKEYLIEFNPKASL